VIYAGNNEDYQVQESYGLTYNYEDKDPQSWLKTNFPARYIYEKVSIQAMRGNEGILINFFSSYFPMSSLQRAHTYRTTQVRHGVMG
jgi:hypothetical protein